MSFIALHRDLVHLEGSLRMGFYSAGGDSLVIQDPVGVVRSVQILIVFLAGKTSRGK